MGSDVPLYDAFGELYDVMVDWPGRIARESPFFERVLREVRARRVLDAGCGTGWHAAHFAQLGVEVVGADPSAEMIRLARQRHGGLPDLRFVQAGLGQLRRAVAGEFDVVTCLGNTLPHVPDAPALAEALADARDVLRPRGLLVIQQLNYDRILAERQRFLGATSQSRGGTDYLFFRFYDLPPAGDQHVDSLVFNLVTFARGTGDAGWGYRVDSTTLRPITASQLTQALTVAGFGQVQTLGDYQGSPFDSASSSDLIVVARRSSD